MKILIALVVLIMAPLTARAGDCASDAALERLGFVVHSSDFESVTAPILAKYEKEKSQFVFDTDARLYDDELHVPVYMVSYDDVRTPQPLMYGDIFLVQNLNTKELYELRWYADGKRHVAYHQTQCALDYIPMADNSLF